MIISAGYRIGPFEVESALLSHPSVAEAAAVATPTRFAARRCAPSSSCATVPSRRRPGPGLQEHVKRETAPYKYPRVIEFADSLPKTASGKIKRASCAPGARPRRGASGGGSPPRYR